MKENIKKITKYYYKICKLKERMNYSLIVQDLTLFNRSLISLTLVFERIFENNFRFSAINSTFFEY